MTIEEIRRPAEALSSYHPHPVILREVRRQPNEVEGPRHCVQPRKPIPISWHWRCDTTGG
jgi:hypothetical protein